MKFNKLGSIIFLGALLACSSIMANSEDEPTINLQPLSGGGFFEYGNAYKTLRNGSEDTDYITLHNTVAWFTQKATINDRLKVAFGVGGTFFYKYPTTSSSAETYFRTSAVGISQAMVQYGFGDIEDPWLNLTVGYFPFKYNSNTKNFGEYLFRAKAYPSQLVNGSWHFVNNAFAEASGFRLNFPMMDKKLNLDLFLTNTIDVYPLYDISIAGLVSYKMENELFEIGAGVNFDRIIPARNSLTQPKQRNNSYFNHSRFPGKTLTGNTEYYSGAETYYGSQISALDEDDPAMAPEIARLEALQSAYSDTLDYLLDTLYVAFDIQEKAANGIPNDESRFTNAEVASITGGYTNEKFYTFQAIKTMAYFSFNIQSILELDILGKDAFKIYGEIAVLGIQDYPLLYDDIMERTPMMLGFHFPTFNLLDNFGVEVEYLPNPWLNSSEKVLQSKIPFPKIGEARVNPWDEDDFRWIIFAQKTIFPRVTAGFQAGKDHLRPIEGNFAPSQASILQLPGAWYYALRLQVSI